MKFCQPESRTVVTDILYSDISDVSDISDGGAIFRLGTFATVSLIKQSREGYIVSKKRIPWQALY